MYFKVPVTTDGTGAKTPDVELDFSVLEYLGTGEVVIETDSTPSAGTKLTDAEVLEAVSNPVVLGAVQVGDIVYSFREPLDGEIPVGIDPEGRIRRRETVTETYEVVVNDSTGETETRTLTRTVLGDAPSKKPLAVKKRKGEWRIGYIENHQIPGTDTGFRYGQNREFPDFKSGKKRRLGDVKKVLK